MGGATTGPADPQFQYWEIGVTAATIVLALAAMHLVGVTRRLTRMATAPELAADGAAIRLVTLRRAAGIGAALLILLGGSVIVGGWIFQIVLFKSVFPGIVAMNPATACCFIAGGGGLLLLLSGRRNFAVACAVAVALAGTLKLAAYALHWNRGIDTLLFHSSLGTNVMAPNTALGFLLIGTALALIDVQRHRVWGPGQLLAVAVGALSLLALIGYAYNTTSLYGVPSYIPMALHTATGFLLLSGSILLARPDRGFMQIITSSGMAGLVARLLLPAAIVVPFGLGWLRLLTENAGVFSSGFGHALTVVLTIVLFVALIWWSASLLFHAERRLHETNRQLEAAARSERTAHEALKMAQSRLVQSEKLVGLGQMVAGVAHEVNNPLSFVGNNMAVLERDVAALHNVVRLYQQADAGLATQQPDLARRISELAERIDLEYTLANLQDLTVRSRDGLKRIQQIVKDLRDFARLDESERQVTDLNTGIASTANIILGRAKAKEVEIALELQPLPAMSCWPAKLNQVVMNLLSNAIDASSAGQKIIVRTRVEAHNGSPDVCIEVIDQGGGIEPQIRDRIFDPFFTTKPIGQGTGLGLSISYGIVQDHGGTIEVDSTPGQGSRFRVRLPVSGPTSSRRHG
jgi:signal transduction histidine kinase